MSNIDVIGDLLRKSNTKDLSKKTIDMKKIFVKYKGKKTKLVLKNPYADLDPKNYRLTKKKENLKKMMKGF